METEVGDLFPVAWKRSSRALSWQLREVSASVTEVTENFLGIMKISSTECEKFVKIAKKNIPKTSSDNLSKTNH